MSRASPQGCGVVVLVLLSLLPAIGAEAPDEKKSEAPPKVERRERRQAEPEFEKLRTQQLEALKEAVRWAGILMWSILGVLVALLVGMVLKSTPIKRHAPFDPLRDRKKPTVSDTNDLES